MSAMRDPTHFVSENIIYHSPTVIAGLTQFPATRDHILISNTDSKDLMSLSPMAFLGLLQKARMVISLVGDKIVESRWGLASDGSALVSLIPLHGVSADWKPIICDEESFHSTYDGYLTTKNGPIIADAELDRVREVISSQTGISSTPDTSFDGPLSDRNLFARIVRGELRQWRVWEDSAHVAFLTPSANTPGYTVLVPRKHLSSDIFGLRDADFDGLVAAAYTVAQELKKAFGIQRCGMFFEGMEIDYAHVKLAPVHATAKALATFKTPIGAAYHDTYQGYLTTSLGPQLKNMLALSDTAQFLREVIQSQRTIVAPGSWRDPRTHPLRTLHSDWYAVMLALQDTLYHETNAFFRNELQFRHVLVPQTTDSISSPIGLGSDSVPVQISSQGDKTYLADSMQFSLEFALRLPGSMPGAYYIGPSCRGGDNDETHMSQFYHAECELVGDLSDAIAIAERYIIRIVSTLLEKHGDSIQAIVGNVDHITDLLRDFHTNDGRFPRITVAKALALEEIDGDSGAYEYAIPNDPCSGTAITRKGERILIEKFNGAVWLTEMEYNCVPFYQAFLPGTGLSKAICADLLLGPGEILGLGQRHRWVEDLVSALLLHEMPETRYQWYVDMRNEEIGGKAVQTSGWGMGIERFLAWLLQHNDIRDISIMPRMKGIRFNP